MDKKALIKYISALMLFGLNGVVASHIALTSYEIVFLRTFIGGIFLTALYLFKKEKFHIRNNGKDIFFIVLSGIAMGANWLFLYEAYQQIGVSLATLLYYCGPVIVMILSPLIFKERLTAPKVVGFVIVVIGVILVNGKATVAGENLWGFFCGMMSAVMYFLLVTFNKQAKKIVGMENSVIQLGVSFLTVAVFMLVKQGIFFHIPKESLPWILMLGIVNTGLGCYLFFSPLSKLPVQTVAICGYIEPLSAVIFATVFLGERMAAVQIIGAVLIIGGAMVGELVKSKREVHIR